MAGADVAGTIYAELLTDDEILLRRRAESPGVIGDSVWRVQRGTPEFEEHFATAYRGIEYSVWLASKVRAILRLDTWHGLC